MQHTCPWWFGYALASPLRRLVQNPSAILGPFVRPGMSVLEIGPGMGFFTADLARLVGERGRVTVLDLQQRMLDGVGRRLERAGYADRARLTRCTGSDPVIGEDRYDFVLLFYVVHEVRERTALFRRVAGSLREGGTVLFSEPLFHVSGAGFRREIAEAGAAGLEVAGGLRVRGARAALLSKSPVRAGSAPAVDGA